MDITLENSTQELFEVGKALYDATVAHHIVNLQYDLAIANCIAKDQYDNLGNEIISEELSICSKALDKSYIVYVNAKQYYKNIVEKHIKIINDMNTEINTSIEFYTKKMISTCDLELQIYGILSYIILGKNLSELINDSIKYINYIEEDLKKISIGSRTDYNFAINGITATKKELITLYIQLQEIVNNIKKVDAERENK